MGIFTLNECKFNEEYCKAVDSFFSEIATNNIKNVIVDLRKNGGGSTQVAEYFAMYLKNLDNIKCGKVEVRKGDKIEIIQPKILTADDLKNFKSDKNLFDGKLFIATSRFTFSSAMQFAMMFSDNNLATIVGESPSNSPEHYGNITEKFITPNSNLEFITTFKKFYRTDPTKNGSKESI